MNKRHREVGHVDSSVDTARLLMLLSQHRADVGVGVGAPAAGLTSVRTRVFECKTCSRQFPTFQALGGHRASHKRPRLQAAGVDAGLCLGRQPAKPRVHECPVCGLEFTIGQALGGHMRRHRAEADGEVINRPAVSEKGADDASDVGGICLDLNLTPSENYDKCRNVGLGSAGQGVHKALPVLDWSL